MLISRCSLTDLSLTLDGGPKAAESRGKELGSAAQNHEEQTDRGTDSWITVFIRTESDLDPFGGLLWRVGAHAQKI